MRRTACRPGVNDIRCKYVERNPYGYLFEEPAPVEQTPSIPQTAQTRAISEPKEDKKKQGSQTLVKPAPIAKPTQSFLTEEQITKAKLAKASDIFHKEGQAKTESYLNDNDLDYTIDWALSNDSGLVLIDNNNGKAVVAYRGTDISSPADWVTGVSMLRNEEAQNSVFKDGKVQMEQVIAEYGAPQELIGFSRGGTLAMTIGNEYSVNTTTFNPFVNKNLATALLSDAEHTIIRTTTDPVSIGANLPNPKFKTVQIAPKENSLNPMTNHELFQFLDNDTPRRQPPLENLQKFVESTGKAQSELITLKDMSRAINEGKSFSEFLGDFSPVDVRDGLSARIYEGSNFTNWWNEMGGSFNQAEQAHLSSAPKGSTTETGTTIQHRAEFGKLSPAEQDVKIAEVGELHMKSLEKFSEFQSGHTQVQEIIEPTLSERATGIATEQLSGASLASGLIGSYVGGKIIEKLDPQQKLKAQGDEAVSGFLAGGIGAALAGGALLPAAIAGSAGALAGSETTRALQRAGVGKVGSSTVGGAVGGATAGVAAAGIGAGAAALSGAEIGSAFAPETFGLSIAIGAGIGALAGLGAALWNDAFGSEDTPPAPSVPIEQQNVFSKTQLRAPKTDFSTPPPVVEAPDLEKEQTQPPLPPPQRPPMTSTMGRSTPVPRSLIKSSS
jgi:hypothetical protein